ncbi:MULTISPECIES: alpha/beta fold hydrolase [unclassified Colwellia]|uniref:alpha/beta fold hydrolase n=1 Tax=unclassified Colwellia TaxID=196834 RepID=UPI0015F69D02|nr:MULTISPECIES: alpha/beta fold hydrolase [unclassified Colwellia]MBA6371298.1 alpha/beta fold hydrolase [Colwellia sp. BRX8-4]MBA6378968.1 alpha/beta fold hydrolase [Colwellia sp. BRX10-7]MBA6386617.1 alpha/beta fold hydrolase [Colwellia sp. BRX10-2]MBA6401076.1 alpha/beta fold hydrolase [Colwellia sp. BRX10-5]MBA6405691.1 alpha/beta fold hydrolase [Colwellia sp. BRX10-1]
MKSYLAFIFLLVNFSSTANDETLLPTKKGLYDVGGFKLYLECYENDKPKLILEQGYSRAGSDGAWMNNVKRLNKTFSICLYDRLGLGKSEKGPVPFTVFDTANWLHELLSVANVKPPYYFAGGSYASYIIRAYNHLYTSDVLGAVFIDPGIYGYFHTMATRWPDGFETENKDLQDIMEFELGVKDPMFKNMAEKVDHLKSYELITASKTFEGKPLIVLFSKTSKDYINQTPRYDEPFVPDSIAKPMNDLYANAINSFKALSTDTKIIFSESKRHHLHIADPDLVVSNIESLIGGN